MMLNLSVVSKQNNKANPVFPTMSMDNAFSTDSAESLGLKGTITFRNPQDTMIQHITPQKAKASLTYVGWLLVKQGKVMLSKDGKWEIYSAGTFYKRKKV
jgi:hypothetical protein